ncbi:NADH-quinone oxidoreductase subunit N [Candidatus Viridilinea mediisalina]|uniref:NADH-quinone oxidoreductase subunit N n=1 Tax=Candidatus Viridilinea mediisalina TaxID=2024553 RepID=A0A2A6RHT4_9CHLR|nr:NADH-quinone oxidoreductase subunit N [Candidatus Viridilinea mediisalina]PDW02694.1 NADH-quinone oxidoreductase subunit N [Candidatus Viridilinea mediisalina]
MEPIQIPPVDLTLIAPLLTITAWAIVLLLVDAFLIPDERKKLTGYLALAGLAVTALVAVPLWNVDGSTFSDMVVLDRYSLTLTWLFLLIGGLTIAMALEYLPRHGIEQGEFYPLILFAVASMILLAQATDLIVIFLGIELLSLTLYILTGFAYPRVTSEEAGMKYLIMGAFAAGFFAYGIALIYGATGSTNLAAINAYLAAEPFVLSEQVLLLAGVGLLLITFGFKIALVPFHMWTPDVYEGAPTPVAAFMSVGTKAAALAVLLRILGSAFPLAYEFWLPVLSVLAAVTMLVGNLGALTQTNVKRMLAYSSISHAGYVLLGVIVATERGVEAFLFYMLAYALTNLGAFAVVIALEQRSESAWSLDDFSGLFQRQPFLAIAMAIFMFSLAGVPPTAGFIAKFYVFTAAYEGGLGWLALIGLLTSAIAVYFYLRVVLRMFTRDPGRPVEPAMDRGLHLNITLAAGLTLLIGLLPMPVVNLVERSLVALGL